MSDEHGVPGLPGQTIAGMREERTRSARVRAKRERLEKEIEALGVELAAVNNRLVRLRNMVERTAIVSTPAIVGGSAVIATAAMLAIGVPMGQGIAVGIVSGGLIGAVALAAAFDRAQYTRGRMRPRPIAAALVVAMGVMVDGTLGWFVQPAHPFVGALLAVGVGTSFAVGCTWHALRGVRAEWERDVDELERDRLDQVIRVKRERLSALSETPARPAETEWSKPVPPDTATNGHVRH